MKLAAALAACALAAAAVGPAFAADAAAAARVEARSTHFLAVGIVRGDTMNVHVSRVLDNAPVTDAAVTVMLRGKAYATTAALDGGYSFKADALRLPGSAAVEFKVAAAGLGERLDGTMRIATQAGSDAPAGRGGIRQFGWWILNFAVCIGFLWLIARRRKSADS